MRYELIAIVGIIFCVALLAAEYLWLYYLAESQETEKKTKQRKSKDADDIINAILFAPTESARKKEAEEFEKFAHSDDFTTDIICKKIIEYKTKKESFSQREKRAFELINEKANPIAFYSKILEDDDINKKGYACIKLAEFGATQKKEEIRELLKKKNRTLKYNAGMALSVLGDEDGVYDFVIGIQNDKRYSFRVINEAIDRYTGNMYNLSKRLIDNSDEYLQSVVIKSIGKFQIPEMLDFILESSKSTSSKIKIAAVKALSEYDDARVIHDLITLSTDKNWVVREYAIKGLAHYSDEESLKAVEKAMSDDEWWVRQAAAKSIIQMDVSLAYVEKIIKGYDRYASEAVKYSLYKTLDLKEEEK